MCVELVAGVAWSAKHCYAGSGKVCMGWVPSKGQRTGLAAIGAGAATAQESHLTTTSGQIRKSEWTGAVHRVSACYGRCYDKTEWQISQADDLHHPQ